MCNYTPRNMSTSYKYIDHAVSVSLLRVCSYSLFYESTNGIKVVL